MNMSTNAEVVCDGFLTNLDQVLGKIDMELALQVMLFERKMQDVDPCVELEIHYKSGTDIPRKIFEVREKYGFEVAGHGKDIVLAKGNMNMSRLQEISRDQDIEKMTGSASIASY
jgi:hypothetical protein